MSLDKKELRRQISTMIGKNDSTDSFDSDDSSDSEIVSSTDSANSQFYG
jgi:hypothetical protein